MVQPSCSLVLCSLGCGVVFQLLEKSWKNSPRALRVFPQVHSLAACAWGLLEGSKVSNNRGRCWCGSAASIRNS